MKKLALRLFVGLVVFLAILSVAANYGEGGVLLAAIGGVAGFSLVGRK